MALTLARNYPSLRPLSRYVGPRNPAPARSRLGGRDDSNFGLKLSAIGAINVLPRLASPHKCRGPDAVVQAAQDAPFSRS
jgi:hypothetical protein